MCQVYYCHSGNKTGFKAEYVGLYQRAKIGFNLHNWGNYGIGSYRLFELPANGVMQISDGDEYLERFFSVGKEIVGWHAADDLLEKIRYYLERDEEREAIARAGYRRVMREYRFADLTRRMAERMRSEMLRRKSGTG